MWHLPRFFVFGSIGVFLFPVPAQDLKKITDINLFVCDVTEFKVLVDAVPETPAFPFFTNVSGRSKVCNYIAYCPLGDTYSRGDLSGSNLRLPG